MKIYFCDLCNESIPQEDLEKSRVTTVHGKMICARCIPPVPAAGAAASGGAGGGGGHFVAVIALLVGGGGLALAWQGKGRLDTAPDLTPRLTLVADTCDRLLESTSGTAKRIDGLSEKLAKLEAEPGSIREALAEQLHRIENEERTVQEMRTLLGSLRSDREFVQRLELTQGRLEHDLAELKSAVQSVTSRVAVLGAAPAAPDGAAASGGAAKEEGPQFDPDTRRLLAELTNKDASARWSAVDRLAKKHDVKLVPHLLPLLEDADAFVQFRVISTLRELNARSAVSRLIKLLRDGDAIVREEALDALVTLTGNAQRFDVANGPPAEREKGVKAWEEWFEKNKDRFAEVGAS